MISSDVIRGTIDTMILCLLMEGDSYGYEISQNIRERTEERYVIKETTLYSAFYRLEKEGCVRPYHTGETHGKRRTYYAITESGKKYYSDKCAEWHLTIDVVKRFIKE